MSRSSSHPVVAPAPHQSGVGYVAPSRGDSFEANEAALQLARDGELVRALQGGDALASMRFFNRIERSVCGALHQVLGRGDHEFEDVYQLALERVVQSVFKGQYAGRCNLGTWAGVVTSRVAIDHLRRRRHERRLFWKKRDEEEDEPEAWAVSTERPDVDWEAKKKAKALRQALSKISPDKAQTVVLYEVMGHDLGEIADIMGVSVAAAQSRLVRGRRELAALLRRDWEAR